MTDILPMRSGFIVFFNDSAGVLVMQRRLEQYTRRVSMERWHFAGLLLLMVLLMLTVCSFRLRRPHRRIQQR